MEQPRATEGLQRGETFGTIRQGTQDGTVSHPHGGVARSLRAEKTKSSGQGKRRKEREMQRESSENSSPEGTGHKVLRGNR